MVPPAVQPMPRAGVIRTRKGKNITLRCAGKGNPNPRISWSKQVCLKTNSVSIFPIIRLLKCVFIIDVRECICFREVSF